MMPKSVPPRLARRRTGPSGEAPRNAGARASGRRTDLLRWRPSHHRRTAIVTRNILAESRIHPAVRARISDEGRAVIAEVEAAVAANAVVVVGMSWNPFPRQARKWLASGGIPYKYIGYGSYVSQWRKRLPLKVWTGWTTFPMIFIDGEFIGGAAELMRMDAPALRQTATTWTARA
jgi:monothiol glutaredoxin